MFSFRSRNVRLSKSLIHNTPFQWPCFALSWEVKSWILRLDESEFSFNACLSFPETIIKSKIKNKEPKIV